MRIAVLGAGPAGLLAAFAARQSGAQVSVLANTMKLGQLPGAQYLHRHIPGLTDDAEEFEIEYEKCGTEEGYALKVYGSETHPVSWGRYSGFVKAWDLRDTYARLHSEFVKHLSTTFVFTELKRGDLWRLASSGRYDGIISTVPLPTVMTGAFVKVNVLITPAQAAMEGNGIMYNGLADFAWSRYSSIKGHAYYEFPEMNLMAHAAAKTPTMIPPDAEVVRAVSVTKPTSYSLSEAVPENVLLTGRYGAWSKDLLAHDAYFQTIEFIRSLKRRNN